MTMDSSSLTVVGRGVNNALLTPLTVRRSSLSSCSVWKQRRVGRSAVFLMASTTGSALRSSSSSLRDIRGVWSPQMGELLSMRGMAIRQVASHVARARDISESDYQHHQGGSPSKKNTTTLSLIFSAYSVSCFILDIIGWILSFPGSLLRFLKKEEKLLDEIEEDIVEGVQLVKLGAKLVEKFADEIEEIAKKAEDIADKVELKTKSIHDEVEDVVGAVEESLESASKITGKQIVLGEETRSKIATIKEKVTDLEERQSKVFGPTTTPEAQHTSSMSSSRIMLDGWTSLSHLMVMMQRVKSLVHVKQSFLLAFRAFIMALAFAMLLNKNVPKLVYLLI